MFSYPDYLQPLPYYSLPPQSEIIRRVQAAKAEGKKIVIASGVFDLLHAAHVKYLEAAKAEGGYLVVLIESDIRTRELKGEGRPIWNQEKRRLEILKLKCVDEVMILPPEFKYPLRFEEIVILLAPDIYAESSNSNALEHKAKLMQKYQGELRIVLNEISGISTTAILKTQEG